MIIETRRKKVENKHTEEWFESNPDKVFMEECSKIDNNPPDTWAKYPNDPMAIVNMEYNELLKATDKVHEIYHLSAALLHLWRHMHKK